MRGGMAVFGGEWEVGATTDRTMLQSSYASCAGRTGLSHPAEHHPCKKLGLRSEASCRPYHTRSSGLLSTAGPSWRLAWAPDRGEGQRCVFLVEWEEVSTGTGYLEAVASLSVEARAAGTSWLQAIVDAVAALWKNV